eukprot:2971648-Pleurochrysis_carterae.AAC.1
MHAAADDVFDLQHRDGTDTCMGQKVSKNTACVPAYSPAGSNTDERLKAQAHHSHELGRFVRMCEYQDLSFRRQME